MNALSRFAPLKFLIVDDDPLLAEFVADHYRELGHQVRHARSGAEALVELEGDRPDVVLCDRRMPGMSGAELLGKVRSRGPDWQSVIFAFVTGLTDRRDRQSMATLGPDEYFHKPIHFPEVDQRLAALLAERLGSRD